MRRTSEPPSPITPSNDCHHQKPIIQFHGLGNVEELPEISDLAQKAKNPRVGLPQCNGAAVYGGSLHTRVAMPQRPTRPWDARVATERINRTLPTTYLTDVHCLIHQMRNPLLLWVYQKRVRHTTSRHTTGSKGGSR